ncbi:hypothetical protein CYMTET_17358 [Cymbomonas tetramitiformis]|uniref:Uncharacterized protein n=1 Tax=Cymbomonas tetramitiformis TaxID=36881 RepID=A0AAE0GAP6_9CHLO|nr:hypothetical protein CYMTET_17358 [Cymbomonas tetramitiformis]
MKGGSGGAWDGWGVALSLEKKDSGSLSRAPRGGGGIALRLRLAESGVEAASVAPRLPQHRVDASGVGPATCGELLHREEQCGHESGATSRRPSRGVLTEGRAIVLRDHNYHGSDEADKALTERRLSALEINQCTEEEVQIPATSLRKIWLTTAVRRR